MATIKSYTDLEQSKKLAEILPLESADCFWDYDDLQKYHRINWFEDGYDKGSQLRLSKDNVRAWSLAALLGVLPEGWSSVLTKSFDGEDYYCKLDGEPIETMADNPVDACYEMILKLHELKML